MTSTFRSTISALALAVAMSGVSQADFVDINMTGWEAFGSFTDPLNSSQIVNIGADSQITGVEFINLEFTAHSPSWQSEFTISVEHADGFGSGFWDWIPADGLDSSGTFGPVTDVFGGATGDGFGAPFGVGPNGLFKAYVYESFNDGAVAPDSTVLQGTLRVNYTPIPEPAVISLLLSLGAIGSCLRYRR